MSWLDSLKAATRGDPKTLTAPERIRVANDVVMMSSMGAAAVTYAPIPLTDFLLVTPVQASMVMAVGRVYGRELDFDESKHIVIELASVCGVSLLAQKGLATLTKIILPGVGGVLVGPYAFGVTYGMGRVAMRYFEDRQHSRESLKRIFEEAVRDAKALFSIEKLNDFRKKWGKEVDDFARNPAKPSSPSSPPPRKKTIGRKRKRATPPQP